MEELHLPALLPSMCDDLTFQVGLRSVVIVSHVYLFTCDLGIRALVILLTRHLLNGVDYNDTLGSAENVLILR